jgi:MFS family permease
MPPDSSSAPAQTPAPFIAPGRGLVLRLGVVQMLSWGCSYYLPALLAVAMARDLGLTPGWIAGGLSWALVISGLTGPWSGRWIDRHGGRPVLSAASVLFALGLTALSYAQGPWSFFAAWTVMGLAMGSGLYESAFAALVRLSGPQARGAISGIALLGGLASTLAWPLTAWLEAHWGWRGACQTWAALQLLVVLPLSLSLPGATPLPHAQPLAAPADPPHETVPRAEESPGHGTGSAPSVTAAASAIGATPAPPRTPVLPAVLLAWVFACGWFNSTAIATQLPALLQAAGLGLAAAVSLGMLIGPAQVAGRIAELSLQRWLPPLRSARLAAATHPVAVSFVLLGGIGWAAPFVLLHGLGNGVLTIVQGTLPLWLFGPQGFGQRQGLLMLPARLAQAAAPLAAGLAVPVWGTDVLWGTGALALSALAALLMLRKPPAPVPE